VVDVLALLDERGVLLESAKGPIPSVAELVAGEPIRGSWWGHQSGREIYAVLEQLEGSPDVARTRLVHGKVTLVHRRVWPALVRLADSYDPERLVAVRSAHTPSGAHRRVETPFPEWVPGELIALGRALSEADALAALPACALPGARGAQRRPGAAGPP
jgi:hypothetical protein